MPAFGDAMYARYKVPIAVAATGVGATSVREWLPKGETMDKPPTTGANVVPTGPGQWASTGAIFDNFMKRCRALGTNGFRAVSAVQDGLPGSFSSEGSPIENLSPEHFQHSPQPCFKIWYWVSRWAGVRPVWAMREMTSLGVTA